MPAHSSHYLQPLNVGCYSPLKQAYGRQIKHLVHIRITHITKLKFLYALRKVFPASITEKNIRGGFVGAGLIPYNPERVLSKLDMQLRTPTPPGPPAASSWFS